MGQMELVIPCKRSCISDVYMDEYILVEILKRLPLKSVCQMRCVCKTWNALLSSFFFIIAHHQQHRHLKSYLLLKRKLRLVCSYALYSPGLGDPPFDHNTTFDTLPFDPFPFRTHQQNDPLIFNDVIHGVVCLTSPLERLSDAPPTILLWNPSLHKYIDIPNAPFQVNGFYNNNQYAPCLGFGFDSHKLDFRVMRLWMPIQDQSRSQRRRRSGSGKPLPLVYEVFSPREGVWQMAVSTSRILPGKVISKPSFFMNGTIHWIVSANKVKVQNHVRKCKEYYRLLMFDCEREEFTTLKLPQVFFRWRYEFINATFIKFRGMLSVMLLAQSSIELWVMEEYGVASTWKRLHYNEAMSEYFGLVSDQTMFLMDAKSHAVSYAKKQDILI